MLVLVVAFFNVDIVQASLDSILYGQHGESFGGDVIVVQQPSVHSTEMTNMLASRKRGNGTSGILHHILIDQSEPLVFGHSFVIPFLHGIVNSSLYEVSCISDGDVIMYGDWAREVRYILKEHPEVYSAAVSLNPFNVYTANVYGSLIITGPDRGDFIEANTGVQMVCYRTDELITLFHNISQISDSHMKSWIYNHGRIVARTKRNQLVHMMWSVYSEPNGAHKEYLDFKAAQKNLWQSPKRPDEIKFDIVF